MGCGASALDIKRKCAPTKVAREYSAAVTNLRAFSSFFSEEPLPVGTVDILKQEHRDIRQFYVFGKIIGKGQFGTCRLVTEKSTGDRYACKSLSKRRLLSTTDIMDVRREVEIMHHLAGHPNIVKIKEVFEDRTHVHMVEELCSGGELFDSIVERGRYTERDAATAFRCIASVVAHCHNMGVMHRDIKPENFLLSSRTADAVLKGTDFGLSIFFSEGQLFKEVVGSAFYVAPEVLRKKYDKRADIWSLGVLLYILLCGVPPFYAETERDIFQAILHAPLSFQEDPWPSISEGAKDVIRRMLDRNVATRATAHEVLRHEWVREDGTAGSAPLDNEVLARLQNFAALNKLQQEALKVIATHLPESEITGLRALFREMDADGSGSITVDELRQALQRKGTRIPAEELQRIMDQADISGDGTLDYEEFLAATINLAKLEHEEHLYMAFRFFDTDDSGFITREELLAALSKVCSEEEVDALLAQADSSGDGRIDYGEFCDLMRSGKSGLVTATRVVKQGLMRTMRSQPLIDVQRLRLESMNMHEGCGYIPGGAGGGGGAGEVGGGGSPPGGAATGAWGGGGGGGHLPPLACAAARSSALTGRSSLTLLAKPRRLQTQTRSTSSKRREEEKAGTRARSGDGHPASPASLRATRGQEQGQEPAGLPGRLASVAVPSKPPSLGKRPPPPPPPSTSTSTSTSTTSKPPSTAVSAAGAAAKPQSAGRLPLASASGSRAASSAAAAVATVSLPASPASAGSPSSPATPIRSHEGLHAVSFKSTLGE